MAFRRFGIVQVGRVAPGNFSPGPSQVGSRAGARPLGAGGNSIAFALDRSPAAIVTFPAPATSNAACGFPALRFPVCFVSGVMGPITLGALSAQIDRSEEHTSELQSLRHLVCRLLLEKK